MKLDLHIHTDHSFNSRVSIESLLSAVRQNHLNAIAVCDHGTMSAVGLVRKMAEDITIIPGLEISTRRGAHIIGLFLKDEIVSLEIDDIIDEIHNQGGLVVLPHPYRPGVGLIHAYEKEGVYDGAEISRILSNVDLVEAAGCGSSQDELIAADRFFKSYSNISQVGCSNAHDAAEIGRVYTEISDFESRNLDEIREALLHAPRTIRFEVYDADGEREPRTAIVPPIGGRALWKTRNILPGMIRRSVSRLLKYQEQNNYRNASGGGASRPQRKNQL